MAQTVSSRQTADAPWTVIQLTEAQCAATFPLPPAGGIFPLSLWLARKQEIICRYKRIGLWLDSKDAVDAVAGDLHYFQVIAIHFNDGVDAWGGTAAGILRDQYRFQGEIRAIGDVSPDQAFYLRSCGFGILPPRETHEPRQGIASLSRFRASAGERQTGRRGAPAPVIDLTSYRQARSLPQSCMARQ